MYDYEIGKKRSGNLNPTGVKELFKFVNDNEMINSDYRCDAESVQNLRETTKSIIHKMELMDKNKQNNEHLDNMIYLCEEDKDADVITIYKADNLLIKRCPQSKLKENYVYLTEKQARALVDADLNSKNVVQNNKKAIDVLKILSK